jgi:hypothetical protein
MEVGAINKCLKDRNILVYQLVLQSKLHQSYGIVYAQFGDQVLAVSFYRTNT